LTLCYKFCTPGGRGEKVPVENLGIPKMRSLTDLVELRISAKRERKKGSTKGDQKITTKDRIQGKIGNKKKTRGEDKGVKLKKYLSHAKKPTGDSYAGGEARG